MQEKVELMLNDEQLQIQILHKETYGYLQEECPQCHNNEDILLVQLSNNKMIAIHDGDCPEEIANQIAKGDYS